MEWLDEFVSLYRADIQIFVNQCHSLGPGSVSQNAIQYIFTDLYILFIPNIYYKAETVWTWET